MFDLPNHHSHGSLDVSSESSDSVTPNSPHLNPNSHSSSNTSAASSLVQAISNMPGIDIFVKLPPLLPTLLQHPLNQQIIHTIYSHAPRLALCQTRLFNPCPLLLLPIPTLLILKLLNLPYLSLIGSLRCMIN